jgi:hypothetical protein
MEEVWLYRNTENLRMYVPVLNTTVVLSKDLHSIDIMEIKAGQIEEREPDEKLNVSEKYINLLKSYDYLSESVRKRSYDILRRADEKWKVKV